MEAKQKLAAVPANEWTSEPVSNSPFNTIHYFWPFLLVIQLYGMDSYSVYCHLTEATTMTTSDVS